MFIRTPSLPVTFVPSVESAQNSTQDLLRGSRPPPPRQSYRCLRDGNCLCELPLSQTVLLGCRSCTGQAGHFPLHLRSSAGAGSPDFRCTCPLHSSECKGQRTGLAPALTCPSFRVFCLTSPLGNLLLYIMCIKYLQTRSPERGTVGGLWGNGPRWGETKGRFRGCTP